MTKVLNKILIILFLTVLALILVFFVTIFIVGLISKHSPLEGLVKIEQTVTITNPQVNIGTKQENKQRNEGK